ncbi:MAG TPA: iron uptake system protein EfeO [Gaiellaceae bacterium]
MTARQGVLAAVLGAVALALAGCGGADSSAESGGRVVSVALTDAGCSPAQLQLAAGPVTFEVKNEGAEAVSEFEILDGDRIVGEVENIAPGLSGKFSLTLSPKEYTTYCPGGDSAERGTLTVAGKEAGQASSRSRAAIDAYRTFVTGQTALLVERTRRFVAAVRAGDVATAKSLYAPARIPYERIEPVAESFGDLDPAIDARAGDVPAAQWTGFHPIEQALWVRKTTDGTSALASKLLADVRALERRAKTIELEPAQIANGSVELLGEVSKSKITGEEERYSHIDLVDFEGNVDGAQAAFKAVRPILAESNPALAGEIDERFAAVDEALAPYRRGQGFVSYTELDATDTRALSRAIDALAEPLSRVGAIVVAAK